MADARSGCHRVGPAESSGALLPAAGTNHHNHAHRIGGRPVALLGRSGWRRLSADLPCADAACST
jgi:hypothetical protein